MNSVRRQRPLLGTFVEVGVMMHGTAAHAAIGAGFRAIETIERLLSFQDPASELSTLNAAPGMEVPLSPLSLRVLGLARGMMRASAGLFDCTVGGALVGRGLLPDHGGPPPLAHGTADDIAIAAGRALLRKPLRITLDGIAKGFAVDRAVAAMRGHGATAGWVNAGGDLRAFGAASVPVVVRDRNGGKHPLGYLQQGAIASSAVTDEHDESFPGYIVGGSNGSRHTGVWTILARHAWRADALTKVAALASETSRKSLIEHLGGMLLVTAAVSPA